MKTTSGELAELLEENGDPGTAHRARVTLPDEVDTDRDEALLTELGVDVEDLRNQV
jgi:hypothetical protein